jgi:hypothetical protein
MASVHIGRILMTDGCCECHKKNDEIQYLKAIIALNGLSDGSKPDREVVDTSMSTIELRQQIKVLQQQLLVIRADVLYMNKEVHSVFAWILKLVNIFLKSCGRLGESTASAVVDSASKVSNSLARLAYINTP